MIKVLAVVKNDIYINAIKNHWGCDQIQFMEISKNPHSTVDLIDKLKPDVVLMDIHWNQQSTGISGAELICKIKSSSASPKIIGLTVAYERTVASHVSKLGVNDFFYRITDNAISELANCIQRVYGESA